ncbi:MAG: amidohydrolase family protein [Planctomycetota bacterium]|nr:amidohydrolase family protein [Planctomycetota bacterium]
MSGLVDTSAFCGHWPFRRLECSVPADLKARWTDLGIREAWVAPFEGVLYQDPQTANEALAEALRGDPFFVQAGAIDLTQPAWRHDAEACVKDLGCGLIKLFPSYHRFELGDARADELAAWAAEARVPVCVQLRMQDERGHHPLVKVPAVKPEDLAAWAQRCPRTRFLACGGYLGDLKKLAGLANLWAETSFVENGNSLPAAMEAFGAERLVFATHGPLYYPGAGAAKVAADEQDVPSAVQDAVWSGNAARLRAF